MDIANYDCFPVTIGGGYEVPTSGSPYASPFRFCLNLTYVPDNWTYKLKNNHSWQYPFWRCPIVSGFANWDITLGDVGTNAWEGIWIELNQVTDLDCSNAFPRNGAARLANTAFTFDGCVNWNGNGIENIGDVKFERMDWWFRNCTSFNKDISQIFNWGDISTLNLGS